MLSRRLWRYIGIVCAVVVFLQLIFPYDRAFFATRVDDEAVGLKTKDEIKKLLDRKYQNATVSLRDVSLSAQLSEIGIDPNTDAVAKKAVDYPLWQRLVPFSSLAKLNATYATSTKLQPPAMSEWAEKVVNQCKQEPVNATIVPNENGEFVITPSKNGRTCNRKVVVEQASKLRLSGHMVLELKPTTNPPAIHEAEAKKLLGRVRGILKEGIEIKVGNTAQRVEGKTIASWINFHENGKGELVTDIATDKMAPFIDEIKRPVYVAPGVSIINVHDGAEVSRTQGAEGRTINQDKLIAGIKEIFTTLQNKSLTTETIALKPKEQYSRSYSNTAHGLAALLRQLSSENKDMAISVAELGGSGRVANANGTKQFHPASTYKLITAYSVIKRIEANQLKWDDQIAGKTVEQCVETMIVDSDNTCPRAFGEKFSWKEINADARSIGMSGTNLNIGDFISTTDDQVVYLTKLHNNQLMKNENKDKLLDFMKRQRFRAGIPAGVGVTVADKVGFLEGLLHDSAIVYGSKTPYVLSIYSKNGTWGNIAAAAKQINTLLSQ